MNHQSHTSGTGDWLAGAVKSNPEGVLLLAAGCALLLRGGPSRRAVSASSRSSSPNYGDARQYSSEGDGRGMSKSSGISGSVSQAADTARQYASDVGKTVTEAASNYASAVGDYSDDARRTIVDQSEQFVEQARTTIQGTISRVLQEQPLALALVGLAAGAAVAAALPATAVERRTLGPAGERLSDAAVSVGENLTEAASKAGEKLMNVAEERGLNAEGLKEVASDVAGAFGGALSGEQSDKQSSVSGSKGQAPGADSRPSGTASDAGYGSATSRTGQSSGQPRSGASPQSGGASGSISNPGQGSGQSSRPSNPGLTKQS
jgi:hypothetical protein